MDGGEFVQPLTFNEIESLKKSGLHASVRPFPILYRVCMLSDIPQEIIKRQIETHANYELKTEYSKDKYKKRKEAKYVSESFNVN